MKYTIGDLAEIIDGDRGKNYPQQHEFSDEGYCLFLNTGNVTKEGFSFNSNQYITKAKSDLLRKGKLQRRDIVYTTRGTVGNAAFYSDDIPYEHIRINSGMIIIRPKEELVCTEFLYQILKSEYYRPYFRRYCTGSAQPQLPIKNFITIELDIPDLQSQRHIADILSTYDALIENNQKQIKLLEEAAQRLYKEWFVDLRFPGHENVKITDSVPEGWTWGTLADIAVFRRGKTITKDQVKAGIIPVVAGGLEPAYYHDTPNTNAPVVTVSGSGANAGFTRMYHTKVWASDCSYIDAAVTKDTAWVYCFLKGNKASIDAMQKGAAQPHVYAKDINAMKALFPDDKLMEQFRVIADLMFTRIGKLDMQIERLAEARDRLLPKLMSGEIEV